MIERSQQTLAEEPAEQDLRGLIEDFFCSAFATDNPLIAEAVRRMLAAGGKRLRPRIALLGAAACGGNPREHLPLAAYLELIHIGTLIHDDVVDRADTRRGVNATAIDFGNRVSVLAGDYLFAWIFKNVTAGYPHPVPHILATTLADITDGEVLQHRALRNLDLTLAGYTEIAVKKTASLFAASAECGGLMAAATPLQRKALRDFGRYYGIAFQMLDDLLDVTASEREIGKPVGNDLREGKMTIPVIFALASGSALFRAKLERYFGTSRDAGAELSTLLDAIVETGGAAQACEAIDGYVDRAKMSLAPLGTATACAELGALAEALVREAQARTRRPASRFEER